MPAAHLATYKSESVNALITCLHHRHGKDQCLVLSVSAVWTKLATRQDTTEQLQIGNCVEKRQNCLVLSAVMFTLPTRTRQDGPHRQCEQAITVPIYPTQAPLFHPGPNSFSDEHQMQAVKATKCLFSQRKVSTLGCQQWRLYTSHAGYWHWRLTRECKPEGYFF